MLEKEIEMKFKNQIEKQGAKVFKFVSPGHAGVPDRIVLMKSGRTVFAELKAPGEKPRPLQVFVMKQLSSLGFDCWVIDSPEMIEKFVRTYFGEGKI